MGQAPCSWHRLDVTEPVLYAGKFFWCKAGTFWIFSRPNFPASEANSREASQRIVLGSGCGHPPVRSCGSQMTISAGNLPGWEAQYRLHCGSLLCTKHPPPPEVCKKKEALLEWSVRRKKNSTSRLKILIPFKPLGMATLLAFFFYVAHRVAGVWF